MPTAKPIGQRLGGGQVRLVVGSLNSVDSIPALSALSTT